LPVRLIQLGEFFQIRFILRVAVHKRFIRLHGNEVRFQSDRRLGEQIVSERGSDIDRQRVFRASERLQRFFGNDGAPFEHRRERGDLCKNFLKNVHAGILGFLRFPEQDPGIQKSGVLFSDFLQQFDSVIQAVFGENILRFLKRRADRRRDFRQVFFHDWHEKSPYFF